MDVNIHADKQNETRNTTTFLTGDTIILTISVKACQSKKTMKNY